jgi:diadenosine tetraphosphatase ApaH/serine/threonine PP2A family protein phosphatase
MPARWTADLTSDFVESIRQLPIATTLIGPDKLSITIAHGSARSNNEGFFPTTTEAKAKEMIGNDPPGLLCVGHSHLPFVRKVNATLLVNVGAVGFPFDGDRRASFGLITWDRDRWEVEIRRLEYAVEEVLEQFDRVNFYQGAGPLSYLIRRELESARPHLMPFEYLFGSLLRERKLSIQKAVEAYMEMSQSEIEEGFLRIFRK